MIREWELSEPLPAGRWTPKRPPEAAWLAGRTWQRVTAEPSGLVDVARYYPRGSTPPCVFARATIHAEKAERRKLRFGYSDYVSIFLNGELLFSGESAYRSRESSFLGVVGLHDALWLPLRPGDNELLLAVSEVMGGWGFLCQDATAVFAAAGVARIWETPAWFRMPESAAWDPVHGASLCVQLRRNESRAARKGSRPSPVSTRMAMPWPPAGSPACATRRGWPWPATGSTRWSGPGWR